MMRTGLRSSQKVLFFKITHLQGILPELGFQGTEVAWRQTLVDTEGALDQDACQGAQGGPAVGRVKSSQQQSFLTGSSHSKPMPLTPLRTPDQENSLPSTPTLVSTQLTSLP